MVIQRGWKILSDSGSTSGSSTEANRSPDQTSSDDSNCSMVASSASPPAFMPETIKYVTTPLMAETLLQRLRQRLGPQIVAGGSSNSESAMRSLELVRIGVQSVFDREIDWIVRRFIEEYFRPALLNLKENLGQNVLIDEAALQKMSCSLLENAKEQYNAFRNKQQSPTLPMPAAASSDNTAAVEPLMTARASLKRSAAKTLEAHEICKRQTPPTPPIMSPCPTATPPTVLTACQQQEPSGTANRPPAVVPPTRRQIFWNTANLSNTTKFVLDVQANQAFGFGTDGNERLASKHPELIRYLPDSDDREWLIAQNIISQQNRNSRFLFLIHDEVCKLQQTPLYRNKPTVDLTIMHTFAVTDIMIEKMKLFFIDLNIKSRGLITSSFTLSAAQCNSHLRNALLQGIVQQSSGTPTPTDSSSSSSSNECIPTATAALQSTQTQQQQQATLPSTTAATNTVSTSSEGSSSSPTSSLMKSLMKPPRTASALSSSHATLTALLNNSAGNGNSASSTGAASDKAVTTKPRK